MPIDLNSANRALSLCRARSSITDIDEVSPEADCVKLWYDTVRQQVLAAHHWNFAKKEESLTLVDDEGVNGWKFTYAFPVSCIWFRYLGTGQVFVPYSMTSTAGARQILTNEVDAVAVYTRDATDVNVWSVPARNAFEHALAGMMTPALNGDLRWTQTLLQRANAIIMDARTADANEDPTQFEQPIPDWLLARGATGSGSVTNMNPHTYGPLFSVI